MTKNKSVPIKESIKYGWEQALNNLGFFIGVAILIWIFTAGPGILSDQISKNFPITAIILSVLSGIISIIIDMGMIKIGLDFVKKKSSKIKELFLQHPKFWRYLGATILYALIIIGGLILFIVPGIIWAIKYQFYGYFIIEKDKGIKEAIKESGKITEGVKWDLLLFNALVILINLVGVITFGIGLVFTIPTTQIATAYMYKKLS